MSVRPVILSGGSGTRLWPLSTHERPKQFADLIPGGVRLFEATLTRLEGVPELGPPIVVTGVDHLVLVEQSMFDVGVDHGLVLVEPEGRNTAPAVAAAVTVAEPDDVLVILPSDHLIGDLEGFRVDVGRAVELARAGSIVTFGVVPVRADTGYGYIEVGEPVDGAHRVARFKEKPDLAEAEALVADGRHFWNSGMFVAHSGTLADEMSRTCPDVITVASRAVVPAEAGVVRLGPGFGDVESISFDHAVMERTRRAVVIPIDVGWDDIGSYPALKDRLAKDENGNSVMGKVVLDGVEGSLVMATSRVVAVAGLVDVVVVETPEAVLVVPLDQAQGIRALAERAGRS